MIHRPDNIRADLGLNRDRVVRSTIAVALAAAAAFGSSATVAKAGARQISVSSYGFADSLLTNDAFEQLPSLSPFRGVGRRVVWFLAAAGAFVVRRSDVLASNTAELSVRKTGDLSGHQMGGSGMTVVERLETDELGLSSWVVVSERSFNQQGSHSWSLAYGVSLDAPWLLGDLYRFEGASFSADSLADPPTTPEASTWVMTLIGFAGLGFAGYRKHGRFSLLMQRGARVP